MIELPSPNYNDRKSPPDMIVLHYTGMKTAKVALDRLCDPEAKVSAHYVIDEDGTVYRLVPEERRAWHAGVSFWKGRPISTARRSALRSSIPAMSSAIVSSRQSRSKHWCCCSMISVIAGIFPTTVS